MLGDLEIHFPSRTVLLSGHPIELTTTQFDLPPTGIEPVYEDENVLVSATRVDHDVDVSNAGRRAIFFRARDIRLGSILMF